MAIFDSFYHDFIPPENKVKIFENQNYIPEYRDDKLWGYSWEKGQTVNIPINLNKIYYVEHGATCYPDYTEGKEEMCADPNDFYFIDENEKEQFGYWGKPGDRYYDRLNHKSYTMISHLNVGNVYIWEQDATLTVPQHGAVQVEFLYDFTDKEVTYKLYNFRRDVIQEDKIEDSHYEVIINDELKGGTYVLSVYEKDLLTNKVSQIQKYHLIVK